MNLQDNLITNRSTFCKTTSSNEGINYFKVNLISSYLIECDILKTKFTNLIDIIDVQIISNASEPFEISSNNQTLLFVKDNLKWKSKRVVNPEDISSSIEFTVPDRKFDFEVKVIGYNQKLNCTYEINSNPICYLPYDYFKTFNVIPMDFQFEFHVKDKNTNNLKIINLDYITFYEFTFIQHLKPFVISHSESLKIPNRFISNTLTGLSKKYEFFCNVTQNNNKISMGTVFDVKTSEFENGLNVNSYFSCSFLSFGNSKDPYNLSISFSSIEGIKSLIKIENEAKIQLKSENILIPISHGSKYGNYTIGPISHFKYPFPTQIYSNYYYSIRMFDRGIYHELKQVNVTNESFELQLVDTSKWYFKWEEVIKSLKIDLFINSIKSFSLNTKFNFYAIEITDISPSDYIPIGSTNSLVFTTKEKWNYIGEIHMKYANNLNEIRIVNCERTNDVYKINCLSPNFDQPSIVSISISLSNGDFIRNTKSIIIYENTMKIKSILPTTITNAYQFVTISGSSFKNQSIIRTKFHNLNMKEIVISKFIDQNTIIASIPKSFYVENMIYPFILNVSISFDNGISYLYTNHSVKVVSLSKINEPNFNYFV